MGKFLLIVVVVAVTVYALFDVLAARREGVRRLNRGVWVVLVLVPLVGPAAWFTLGRPRRVVQRPRSEPPRGAVGPDDDPDFLRKIPPPRPRDSFDSWEDELLGRQRKERANPPADEATGPTPAGPAAAAGPEPAADAEPDPHPDDQRPDDRRG